MIFLLLWDGLDVVFKLFLGNLFFVVFVFFFFVLRFFVEVGRVRFNVLLFLVMLVKIRFWERI